MPVKQKLKIENIQLHYQLLLVTMLQQYWLKPMLMQNSLTLSDIPLL